MWLCLQGGSGAVAYLGAYCIGRADSPVDRKQTASIEDFRFSNEMQPAVQRLEYPTGCVQGRGLGVGASTQIPFISKTMRQDMALRAPGPSAGVVLTGADRQKRIACTKDLEFSYNLQVAVIYRNLHHGGWGGV
jgi:hypothetical protein